MASNLKFHSHEDYFASLPCEMRKIALAIQSAIQAAAPESKPCISYNMPAFRLDRTFIYFVVDVNYLDRSATTILAGGSGE